MNKQTNQEGLSLENKRAHWDKIVGDYLASGLKQREYARQHHLRACSKSFKYDKFKHRKF